ncbi:hypothetical protein [Mediterranea massiliensis]|uniref:hypothetical protein n=1 Tax=Mediterranea massiliensis TaxID=1841865 RepID=UPI0025A4A78E|nr:hypothetical protein [Mediterranea massiliensis]MDM8336434.1 hypothetical protein [Mediterranea massiliensis]
MKKTLISICALTAILMSGCTNDDNILSTEEKVLTRAASQTVFSNQTVTSDKTITGIDIISENVTVRSGAKLTLKASQSITINKPYTIEAGAQIEITH